MDDACILLTMWARCSQKLKVLVNFFTEKNIMKNERLNSGLLMERLVIDSSEGTLTVSHSNIHVYLGALICEDGKTHRYHTKTEIGYCATPLSSVTVSEPC